MVVGADGSPLKVSVLAALEPQALFAITDSVLLEVKLALVKLTTIEVVPCPDVITAPEGTDQV